MYTIHDIVSLTGVKKRTLEDWRRLGLLPGPIASTVQGQFRRFAQYDDHYLRAVERVKRDFQDQRVTRHELAERIAWERRGHAM